MRYVICSIAIVLAGCALFSAPDPQRAEQLRQEAEALVVQQDYAGAAVRLQDALRHQPDAERLYLRLGELQEASDNPIGARRTYESGLKTLPPGNDARLELVHRLATLLILKLDAPAAARPLLPQVPSDSARYDDLLGLFAVTEERQRDALLHFNAALAKRPGNELTAMLLYHAALVYDRLGDEKNRASTLYEAINRAGSVALVADIERLWTRTKEGTEEKAAAQP